jgi:hypothetical protein
MVDEFHSSPHLMGFILGDELDSVMMVLVTTRESSEKSLLEKLGWKFLRSFGDEYTYQWDWNKGQPWFSPHPFPTHGNISP